MKVKYAKSMYHDLHNVLILLCSFFSQMNGEKGTFLLLRHIFIQAESWEGVKWFKLNNNKIRHEL